MAGHRSTLKKANKAFKSPHSSKRSLKALNKGKVEKVVANNKTIRVTTKNERKNHNNQLKKNKIEKNLQIQSLFNSNKIEKIITILPLTKNQSPYEIISLILKEELNLSIDEFTKKLNGKNIFEISLKKFKSNLKFIIPNLNDLISILDACKVSDFVIFGLSAIEEVDPNYGEQIIRSVEAQGISTSFAVLPDIVSNYPKKNLQLDVYKSLFSYYQHFFPNVDKLYILENKNDSSNLLRSLCQKIPKGIHWRDNRGYLVADHLDKISGNSENENLLIIDGIVRGTGFNINGLIHLPGFGDFQIEKIEKFEVHNDKISGIDETIIPTNNESLNILQDKDNDDLSMDEMDDDENDYDDDEDYDDWNLVDKKIQSKSRRLPKGLSEYQAKWMKDEEIEAMLKEVGYQDDGDINETRNDSMNDDIDQDKIEDEDDDDDEEVMEMDISPEEHERQLQEYRKREREELDFPDEIELRYDEIATDRLSRYRGVKSLASCFWDYDEKDERRPENWLNYLRVKNYKIYRNQLLKKFKSTINVKAGDRIRITIKFNDSDLQKLSDPKLKPFVIYSLLQNENKLSVCNFSVQTWESYEEPIKSKESMIVQYGFRRYSINPLFSQHTRNANNVAKFQRFLHKGQFAVASAIVPISFASVPALFFKSNPDGSNMEILCQGTFENTDFTRILVKRVVLTGEVFKIHKNVVTIRFMFFNSDDVNAYKNVPLFSKMGRSGFIKESLGTHGDFKASFDSKLNQQDIIGMELFKRVWPKQGSLAPF